MQALIKQYGIWIAFALTLFATFWVASQEEAEAPQIEVIPSNSVAIKKPIIKENNALQPNNSTLIQREEINEAPGNLFATLKSANILPVTENIDSIPVNPFIFAGKLVDEGKVTVFLIDGDKSHAVKTGNVIEELWQVKSIRPPTMVLKNLSTKIEIKMDIGVIS
jgi:hypothetical protein